LDYSECDCGRTVRATPDFSTTFDSGDPNLYFEMSPVVIGCVITLLEMSGFFKTPGSYLEIFGKTSTFEFPTFDDAIICIWVPGTADSIPIAPEPTVPEKNAKNLSDGDFRFFRNLEFRTFDASIVCILFPGFRIYPYSWPRPDGFARKTRKTPLSR
jgi:hypothetical protein